MALEKIFLFALLIQLSAGRINLTPASAIKYTGDTFMVNCKDMSGRQVAWSGPKGPLGPKTQPRVEITSFGTALTFANVNVKDSGNYTCSIVNGHEKNLFHLIIKSPLTFMDTSPIQTGTENAPVTLRCEVKGDDASGDKPIVTWGDLKDPRYQIIGDGLLIKNVSRDDHNRTFVCKAMQPSTGDIREQRIQLKVEHKPIFKHPVYAKGEEAWGFIGGQVNLTCEVDAEPPPTFEWYWKKQRLSDLRIHNISSHMSVLQVYVKDATKFGNYMCKVKNKIGTLEKIFILQQGIQAQPPDFIELRGANSDLLDIGVHGNRSFEKLPLSQRVTSYRLQYRVKGAKLWSHQDFSISDDNSYPLQHLQHDTEYLVRAATMNKAGLSEYTNTSVFRTLTSEADSAGQCGGSTPPSLLTLMVCSTASSILLRAFNVIKV